MMGVSSLEDFLSGLEQIEAVYIWASLSCCGGGGSLHGSMNCVWLEVDVFL